MILTDLSLLCGTSFRLPSHHSLHCRTCLHLIGPRLEPASHNLPSARGQSNHLNQEPRQSPHHHRRVIQRFKDGEHRKKILRLRPNPLRVPKEIELAVWWVRLSEEAKKECGFVRDTSLKINLVGSKGWIAADARFQGSGKSASKLHYPQRTITGRRHSIAATETDAGQFTTPKACCSHNVSRLVSRRGF